MNEIKNLWNSFKQTIFNFKFGGNEALVKKNMDKLNALTDDDYLNKVKENDLARAEIINAKKHLDSHKEDYVAYFKNAYLEEEVEVQGRYTNTKMKRKDYINNKLLKSTKYGWIKFGIGFASILLFSHINLLVNLIISLGLAFNLPKIYELYLKPYFMGEQKYNEVLDNLKDKNDVLIMEKSEKRDIDKEDIADLSLDIARCIDDIQKEPYPGCEREIDALKNLNYEFLAEELKSRTEPTKIELKLVFKDYKAAFEDLKKYVLEQQMIERSKKVVEDAINEQPVIPKKLGRYRVKN